jgi:hypothetical protein
MVWHIERLGKIIKTTNFFSQNQQRDRFEDLDLNVRTILKYILEKEHGVEWSHVSMWLRIQSSDAFLWAWL